MSRAHQADDAGMTLSAIPGSVHIIGSGLIGTSLGLALARAGIDVTLADLDETHLAQAIELGAGRRRSPADDPPFLVVAATPPGRVGMVLAEAAATWENSTLTHVGSVQSATLTDAIARGVPRQRLVGGHPMAGREISGPSGARADLFDDRVWVICPTDDGDPDRVEQVVSMARSCGSTVVRMDPEAHDAAVAVISHTPQVLASALAGRLVDVDDTVVELSGQGLRDMTRIAASDSALWAEILELNAATVANVLGEVISDLDRIAGALRSAVREGDDGQTVDELLRRGVDGQARIPGKHGGRGGDYEIVSVMVKDEPGELASLFVAAGALGVNLEDVRIEHVLGRPSGLIDLSVRPQVAELLREGLMRQGFDVRG